jgi:hypothetical protein
MLLTSRRTGCWDGFKTVPMTGESPAWLQYPRLPLTKRSAKAGDRYFCARRGAPQSFIWTDPKRLPDLVPVNSPMASPTRLDIQDERGHSEPMRLARVVAHRGAIQRAVKTFASRITAIGINQAFSIGTHILHSAEATRLMWLTPDPAESLGDTEFLSRMPLGGPGAGQMVTLAAPSLQSS